MSKTVWITGAGGYIGGQCILEFEDAGYIAVGLDTSEVHGYKSDYGSPDVSYFLSGDKPDIIVHCAATSLVGPSMQDPGSYYNNNVAKTITFLENIRNTVPDAHFIFASSAAVYGEPSSTEWLTEQSNADPISPYGRSKQMIEQILHDYSDIYGMKTTSLRFFNVCGADLDQRHGQTDDATHIIPSIIRALKNDQPVQINGNNYRGKDGTCTRDYVHVCDVASAVRKCAESQAFGIYNVGGPHAYTVLDIVRAFESVLDRTIEISYGPRRAGDPDVLKADTTLLETKTDWVPTHDLKTMVETAWQWHSK